ncbi:isoleucine--tRNA ligase [Candidatus Poriferisodalis sp.]|uniref:isoleucine--tRNA ligase n=1 Tax=Candidatus Poriferisodalis sp. TaxID=3101277 RepID=UPI003B523129
MREPIDTVYPRVFAQADFPRIEERILARWQDEGTFEASISNRPADDEFVFYDGPPFANGLPHHGHLLTGYVKDVIPRYQTMRGHRVNRRFGWDCHGLPAEMETERELGVAGRAAITDFGIERFNAQCRESVLRYTAEWRKTVTRQARWVDFDNDYKTMDLPYMESVMWAFKRLWDQGLVYQAFRVMPYSWGAETPLSNFEIRLDDATRPRQDPAITVWFELDDTGDTAGAGGASDTAGAAGAGDTAGASDTAGPLRLLAWTTTPWTLPSNLAIAVGGDIDYAVVESAALGSGRYVLASDCLEHYGEDLEPFTVVGTLSGAELAGRRYAPMFEFFDHRSEAFRVLSGDFVDTSEGTGVVHLAPGFGEDDQIICEANGIEIGDAVPVDDRGCFTEQVSPWATLNVFEANPQIIVELKSRNRVLRHDSYEHNYPHCWRTDTPIIYKAISSWYVKVTAISDRLAQTNQEINWVPAHVRDGRFGQWLAGARDWSISRNRFWGSPIPIWVSDDPEYPRIDVYGSLDELEADFGVRPTDLHRPFIDELTRPNPDDPTGRSMMRRVPEVLDCWFESGSMPFAAVHYPFENSEWFEKNFPADFIVEYINQTRGWFYTLHVLAGALFSQPAFQNVICHGILLAADGNKLSKRLRNYTEPTDIFANQGSDALRWYLMATNIVRGGDTRITDAGIDEVARQVLIPMRNAYAFFTLYANADGYEARFRVDSDNVLDRYLLAKTRATLESVTASFDAYDLPGAAAELRAFIDALNNWYIRRSRGRFWGEAAVGSLVGDGRPTGDRDAFDTLYTVLRIFSAMAAPLLPMITEEIYGGLTGGDSVHLSDWPDPETLPSDPELVERMDAVRAAASAALRVREDAGLRVRLPLRSVTVAGAGAELLEPFAELLAEEINVTEVVLRDELGTLATPVLRPSGSTLGPRLGSAAQEVFAAARSGNWRAEPDGSVIAGGHQLNDGEFQLSLQPADPSTTSVLDAQRLVVVLDTTVTPELEAEGAARDLIRNVQQTRKEAGLDVTDRISLKIRWSPPNLDAVRRHEPLVTAAVLAEEIEWLGGGDAPEIELAVFSQAAGS